MSTDHFVEPALFVPPSTQENYVEGARLAARMNGTTVGDEWAEVIANFERLHESDGAAGWNHLAAWAKTIDVDTFGDPTVSPTEVRKARELASAIQDPSLPSVLDLSEGEAKDAVDHAIATNEARQESMPGSPAGADPARVNADGGQSPVAPEVKSGLTDEGGADSTGGSGDTESGSGSEEREGAAPTRKAVPPKKTTR